MIAFRASRVVGRLKLGVTVGTGVCRLRGYKVSANDGPAAPVICGLNILLSLDSSLNDVGRPDLRGLPIGHGHALL